MSRLRRLVVLAMPSVAAALAAALAAGLIEGLRAGRGWWPAVSACALAAAGTAPAGFALDILVRALWRSWRPLLAAPATSEPSAASNAAARVAGGLWFGILAVSLVAAAGWIGATAAASLTHVPRLAALTVGLFALAAGAVTALLSVPGTRALAALVLAFDRRRQRNRGRHAFARARAVTVTGAIAAALAFALWLALLLRPEGGPSRYLATFALALPAAHAIAGWRRRRASRRWKREDAMGAEPGSETH